MKPAGKVRCNMRTKLAIVPVKFKYCFGGKSPRTSFCNGTVLIAVDYHGWFLGDGSPGNPTRPSEGTARLSGGALRFPRAGAAGAHRTGRQIHALVSWS